MEAPASSRRVERPAHRPELDGLRAVAVLGVVYFHAAAPAAFHVFQSANEAIGARGVDLFFVLSGFCLSWPLDRESMKTTKDYFAFLRRRLTRIGPSYYIALGLFAALALTRFGVPDNGAPVAAHDRVADLVRDIAFFPTLSPIFDPPIWTLGFEMRWYVLFPVLFAIFGRSKVAFAIVAGIFYWLYFALGVLDCGLLPTFMLGIVAAHLVKSDAAFNRFWPIVAPVALVAAIVNQRQSNSLDHTNVLWQFACFALVLAVTTNPWLRRIFSGRTIVFVGVASYSIYLIHDPILDALAWVRVPIPIAAIVSVCCGVGFWYVVERPLGSRRARTAMDRALVAPWRFLGFTRGRPADSVGHADA